MLEKGGPIKKRHWSTTMGIITVYNLRIEPEKECLRHTWFDWERDCSKSKEEAANVRYEIQHQRHFKKFQFHKSTDFQQILEI